MNIQISMSTTPKVGTIAWAKSARISNLVSFLKKADRAYHDTGNPIISDKKYDRLKEILEERDSSNPYLEKVGAAPKRNRTTLPYYMPSLNKLKPGGRSIKTVGSWVKTHEGPYLISDKLDGISLLLIYKNNKISVYTRGDGKIGQNVSYLLKYLRIPKDINKDFVLRAEAIIPESTFRRKYSTENNSNGFENSRNMGAGIINRLKDAPELKDFRVVVHEVIEPKNIIPSKGLLEAKKLGFDVVPFKRERTLDESYLIQHLNERKKKSKFEIDGLVVTQDKRNKRVTSGNPDYSVSFKVDSLDAAVSVKVKDVEWNLTRTNYLFPRIIIPPTRIGGVTVSKVSGKNAKFILDSGIGPGAKIKVIRAGDVIPDVVEVEKKAAIKWPEVEHKWSSTKVDLIAKDISENSVLAMEHFFKTLGVDGLREGLLKKFVSVGLDSVEKIIKADENDFLKAPGIQIKTASKIRRNIDHALKTSTFAVLGDASGIFGRTIGTRKLEAAYKMYPNILEMSNLSERELTNRLNKVPGYSQKTSQRVAKSLPLFKKFLRSCGIKLKKPVTGSNRLQHLNIVFSGFRDKELETKIKNQGGEVENTVTRKTNLVVVKNRTTDSTKTQKAKANNIAIVTIEEFIRRYI